MAAAAIFHSNRQAMSTDTKTKNTSNARIDLMVILRPHDELTAATLTSSTGSPAFSASAVCTASRTAVLWSPTCTRIRSPSAPCNVCNFAFDVSMSFASSTSRTASMLNVAVTGASQATPPRKSIPRFKPPMMSATTETTRNAPETTNAGLRLL